LTFVIDIYLAMYWNQKQIDEIRAEGIQGSRWMAGCMSRAMAWLMYYEY
jgi:hypothetical protein